MLLTSPTCHLLTALSPLASGARMMQVFASVYILSANRNSADVRWTAARILLDFLQVSQGLIIRN
jgi:hypothetical protein